MQESASLRTPRSRPALPHLVPALTALLLVAGALPAAAQTISLSEIRIDQPSTDNDEYFELTGAPGASLDGLTYLVIGDGSGGSGVVEAVVDLTGLSIPASGFFVAAEGTFGLGTADLFTNLNFENGDNVTHLVVRDFSAANGDDLDADDDGTLDAPPWSELVDCLALIASPGSGDLTYCSTTLGPDGSFVPAHAFDCPAGWEIGAFDPAAGLDTPGAANACGAPPVAVELSEIRIDQPSTDNDEYFELAGAPGDLLDGLTYLVIGDGTGGSGVVEAVVDLTGLSIPASGFFVAAEGTFSLGTADLFTNLNFENGDNVTHLVVRDFSAANGDDLDADDDGILDAPPWSELVDCLALIASVGSGDLTYCSTTLGPDGSFVPAHAFNCPAGWEIGAFDPGTGLDTPGAANDCPTPALVINEIDYDQPSTDFGEFIEIKNTGTGSVDLDPYALVLVNGTGGGASIYQTIDLPAVSLAAGDYFVVCGDAAQVANCDLDVSPDSNLIQNGDPDAVALTLGGAIVDTVSYEGDTAAPYTEGSGAGLEDPSSGGVGGPDENKGISRFPDGADSNQNNVDLSTRCVTPGAANGAASEDCPSARPPVLVVNEVDYDQPGDDTAEFIEIKNAGTGAVELGGLALELVNGSTGSVYRTISLPAVSLAAGDYFVVCGDAAQVANCDLDVTPDSNLVQNGAPDAVALVDGGTILDTLSYEGATAAPYTEGSGAGADSSSDAFLGLSRLPDGADSDDNSADFALACITPGAANTPLTTGCSPVGPVLEIWEIQGDGATSPFAGFGISTLDNVVTALGVDGFFIQTPPERTDGDVDTSDGIFVFTGAAPVGVAVGDRVDVSAQVQEFFDFTELTGASFTVVGSGSPLPAAVTFDETVPARDPAFPSCAIEYECYEGMLIDVPAGVVGGPNQRFNPDPVAEIHVAAGDDRPFREKGIELPGLVGLPVWDGNPEVFELDPDKLGLPNQVVPAGSTFSARGVLGFEFGGYELWPTEFTFTPAVLPQAVRARAAGEFTVGSLNLFRLFDDVADGGEEVVPAAEYARRLTKFSRYIREVLDAPDVLGVQEVEKLGVLQDLAAVIFADDPSVVYSAFLVEGNDVGGIDVGFLVRQSVAVDAVTQLGAAETLSVDGSLLHDRPPLLLEGRYLCPTGGEFPLAVMVNHNRSLGGIDDPADGPRVRQKRLEQAQSIAQKAQGYQTANPAVPLLLIGDYNAFEFTDGYVDVIGQIAGDFDPSESLLSGPDLVDPNLVKQVLSLPAEERYSFIFGGSAQVLDHALVSAAAEPWVRGFEYGRGNADAAVDLINDGSTLLRSSDHDGFVLYLESDCDGDGVPFSLDVCLGTGIPEGVPTVSLGTNRYALVDGDGVFDTNAPPGGGPGDVFTVEDTAGCSCEQIIDALGLGKGHEKFGCSVGVMRNWVEMVQP